MRFVTVIFLFSLLLFGDPLNRVMSDIPIPRLYIIDYDKDGCDEECLNTLYEKGKLFSFITSYTPQNSSIQNGNRYRELTSLLNVDIESVLMNDQESLKIALLVPKKVVGRYAVSTSHSILAFLLLKNEKFNFKTFDSGGENIESLRGSLGDIQKEGFTKVVALLTSEGAQNLVSVDEHKNFDIYIPSVNKNTLDKTSDSIVYGGIDYKQQIDRLLSVFSNRLVISLNGGGVGGMLTGMVRKARSDSYEIDFGEMDSGQIKKDMSIYRDALREGLTFLNSPIVKSSMFLSQLSFNNITPYRVVSTQLNYSPLLFTLTQPKDRDRLIIANSIINANKTLNEANTLLETDIKYDWVNYATAIGINRFYNEFYKGANMMTFPEEIVSGEVVYGIEFLESSEGRFMKVDF